MPKPGFWKLSYPKPPGQRYPKHLSLRSRLNRRKLKQIPSLLSYLQCKKKVLYIESRSLPTQRLSVAITLQFQVKVIRLSNTCTRAVTEQLLGNSAHLKKQPNFLMYAGNQIILRHLS